MGFAEDMKKLAERLASIESQVTTEEATKMSLILPFFQLLGYDVFNPSEFCPEFTADVGIKKGEKVDYAILRSGQPSHTDRSKGRQQKAGQAQFPAFPLFCYNAG